LASIVCSGLVSSIQPGSKTPISSASKSSSSFVLVLVVDC
jgi:hypothetical protein